MRNRKWQITEAFLDQLDANGAPELAIFESIFHLLQSGMVDAARRFVAIVFGK